MTQADMLSINTVAAKLGLSVHQLRRWELMFGLEIKRGRGQQRQYRSEDLTVLERIKELVEQGWPTSQIRPQLEAEGLIIPKLIGMPQQSGNPEMLMEAVIGLRSFSERRFIEISKQIDELRQLMISITLKNELRNEISSPWQPVEEEFAPPAPSLPPQEISIGPAVNVSMAMNPEFAPPPQKLKPVAVPKPPIPDPVDDLLAEELEALIGAEIDEAEGEEAEEEKHSAALPPATPLPAVAASSQAQLAAPPISSPPSTASAGQDDAPKKSSNYNLGDITDQNYLTVLGKALDMIGWSDEQADQYSQKEFGVAHWDELGRIQTEKLIAFLLEKLNANGDAAAV